MSKHKRNPELPPGLTLEQLRAVAYLAEQFGGFDRLRMALQEAETFTKGSIAGSDDKGTVSGTRKPKR